MIYKTKLERFKHIQEIILILKNYEMLTPLQKEEVLTCGESQNRLIFDYNAEKLIASTYPYNWLLDFPHDLLSLVKDKDPRYRDTSIKRLFSLTDINYNTVITYKKDKERALSLMTIFKNLKKLNLPRSMKVHVEELLKMNLTGLKVWERNEVIKTLKFKGVL